MKKYINNDERLGDCVEFTEEEILDLFNDNFWNRNEDGSIMPDHEVLEMVLTKYNVKEI